MGTSQSFMARIRRGHIISRLYGRAVREIQSLITTVVLTLTRPTPGRVAIITLNADEENATAQAVLLTDEIDAHQIRLVTPDPEVSRVAVGLAAKRLEREIPLDLIYRQLGYWALLKQYLLADTTYSTHVLLPGRDYSRRRRHVHLTHGSGPKPDTTFRSPANVLASITPHWVPSQLREYKMRPDAEVIDYMPRLEIMKRSVGDRSIIERLGLDPRRKLVVWAPTFRIRVRGSEHISHGQPLSQLGTTDSTINAISIGHLVEGMGAQLLIKVHPHDADRSYALGSTVMTNGDLRELQVSSYELFGSADSLITDYSSTCIERAALNLSFVLACPDLVEFSIGPKGLRTPGLNALFPQYLVGSPSELGTALNQALQSDSN